MEQIYAVVLTGTGDVTVPDITFVWWDTATDSEKTTLIPGRTLSVEPQLTGSMPSASARGSMRIDATTSTGTTSWWIWILAVPVILFLFWLVETRFRLAGVFSNAAVNFQLKRACLANNPNSARRRLIEWAAAGKAGISKDLREIRKTADSASFKSELALLDEVLFSGRSIPWSGRSLWDAFAEEKRYPRRPGSGRFERDMNTLPKLYSTTG